MARSGQVTVTTAGTAVPGPNEACHHVSITGKAANTGVIYVGNDGAGDVTAMNGYELDAGDHVVLSVGNLNELRFDALNNGDIVCWIKID